MTMGWGGYHGDNEPRRPGNQETLVKEHQIADQTLRATFPYAETGDQVRFELVMISNGNSNDLTIESTSLKIRRPGTSGSNTSFITVDPAPSQSRSGQWIFPYRFHESGDYEITFTVKYQSSKESTSVTTISAHRSVSESYTSHHRYNTIPWIAGGAVMTGLMIWMMTAN
jgi:hypothetical protein